MKVDKTLILACVASAAAGVIIGMMIEPEDRDKIKSGIIKLGEGLLSGSGIPGLVQDDLKEEKS